MNIDIINLTSAQETEFGVLQDGDLFYLPGAGKTENNILMKISSSIAVTLKNPDCKLIDRNKEVFKIDHSLLIDDSYRNPVDDTEGIPGVISLLKNIADFQMQTNMHLSEAIERFKGPVEIEPEKKIKARKIGGKIIYGKIHAIEKGTWSNDMQDWKAVLITDSTVKIHVDAYMKEVHRQLMSEAENESNN